MNKILLIGGSTGVGKTKLSLLCAELFNGYLISCDSMQIYRDMNIGTAKVDEETQKKFPHALIDIVSPNDEFSVSDYVNICKTEIEKAKNLNKLPILVGGTGLYMKSVLFPYSFNKTKKDEILREKYKAIAKEKGNEYLHNILKEKDPELAQKYHFNDTKRVIRALEILENHETLTQDDLTSVYDYELIVLTEDRQILYDRINKRVEEMFDLGLLDEVKYVINKYNLTRDSQSMQAIGYREFFDYFEGKISLEDVKEKIKLNSRHYAKRQITWFKTMPNAKFFSIEDEDKIIKYLKESL